METSNNSNKKLIIICIILVLVVAIVMTGVFIVTKDKPSENMVMGDVIGMEMSYEEFTFGMKENLSKEVMDEVESLYNEFVEAAENNDDKAMMKVFEKLIEMDVYDGNTMQSGMIEMSPKEFAELDSDGDGVIVFEEGELPDGFVIEPQGGN